MNYCGIDVSAQELIAALRTAAGDLLQKTFPNTSAGHRRLLAWLQRSGSALRITLEATGVYSLDLALWRAATPASGTGRGQSQTDPPRCPSLDERSKDDPLDARLLLEYSQRMPFRRWLASSFPHAPGLARHHPSHAGPYPISYGYP